jgi:inhibitor of KinA sporulation pathway (predicted exonuclease)
LCIGYRDGTLLDSHSFLVRPTRFPQLSEFCTALTSITQSILISMLTQNQLVHA